MGAAVGVAWGDEIPGLEPGDTTMEVAQRFIAYRLLQPQMPCGVHQLSHA